MSDVGCWMLNVGCVISDLGCWMLDVGCGMWDVGCGMWDVRRVDSGAALNPEPKPLIPQKKKGTLFRAPIFQSLNQTYIIGRIYVFRH
jgi:hypothetical protein